MELQDRQVVLTGDSGAVGSAVAARELANSADGTRGGMHGMTGRNCENKSVCRKALCYVR